ncbi:MAG: glycosyltransferase family 4 protein [Verrucomicrobia bacterium]|nr:glycosyltransferase family 4 protein [Verrucomicrobiota bacterium]
MASDRTTSHAADGWQTPRHEGLFFDTFTTGSAWLRGHAVLRLPPHEGPGAVTLLGEFRPHPDARGLEVTPPSLTVRLDGAPVATLSALQPGPFSVTIPVPPATALRGFTIALDLGGTAFTNFLAWLGRVTALAGLQRFRAQNKNRQLRIAALTLGSSAEGERIFDFSVRLAPYSLGFARRHTHLAFNLAGFLTADLGVGESARCMARAADAAGIELALVPLKLNCKNRLGDLSFADRLQSANPHRINVVHIDAPASADIDHHHGKAFRAGKYNIGYWAWELPEFPDAWVPSFAFFDEIWTPSDFATAAIAMKSPRPVLTMPHAISFARPTGDLRTRFGLPADKFLFLFLYDLNSYSARKNPQAVLAAFHRAVAASPAFASQAALVIKVQNTAENPADFAALQAAVADLPGTVLITGTLPREEIYALEAACDCFVSLHRAEGFGLAVAESMYLGKPVISTDWSATAEFVNHDNGCPVRCTLTTIEQTHGPYTKGQTWAEPDVAHAAEWMQRLCADRALAARLGTAGRVTIETRFSPAAIGARYRRRLESLATF